MEDSDLALRSLAWAPLSRMFGEILKAQGHGNFFAVCAIAKTMSSLGF